MPNLYMHVFTDAKEVALGEPEQRFTMAIGSVSAQSSAITLNGTLPHKRVRFFAEAGCFVTWNEDPTADDTCIPMGVENPEYFDLKVGDKIAVIQRTVA